MLSTLVFLWNRSFGGQASFLTTLFVNLFRRYLLLLLAWGYVGGAWAVDWDGDGYDDVWQRLHGVTLGEFPLGGDFDKDGLTNLEESLAGTDPRNPGDVLRIQRVIRQDDSLIFRLKTVAGKHYHLQESVAPGGGAWVDIGSSLAGNGTVQGITAVPERTWDRRFYRVRVFDQDRDGDGLSDWVEVATGTDPSLTNSAGNASGGVASDVETLRSLLSLRVLPVAGSEDAYEKEARPARLRVERSYGTMPLRVDIRLLPQVDSRRATATAEDFTLFSTPANVLTLTGDAGQLNIPEGHTGVDIFVNPIKNNRPQVPRHVRLALLQKGTTATLHEATVAVVDADPKLVENRQLFVAYLSKESGAQTTASGVATAQVAGDRRSALVSLSFSNLTSPQNTAYLRVGADRELHNIGVGQVTNQEWLIRAGQILVTDQAALDALYSGQLYIAVTTANYTNGELKGHLQPAEGSVVDPPAPAAPPVYGSSAFPNLAASGVENNEALDRDIVRFLTQATFGATKESVAELRSLMTANGNDALAGYAAWIDRQQDLARVPSPSLLKLVQAADVEEFILRGNAPSTFGGDPQFSGTVQQWNNASRTWVTSNIRNNNHPNHNNRRREWWTLVLQSPDQLRQRLAFALSQIFVISDDDTVIRNYHYGAAQYWDQLAQNAFGNYRSVVEGVAYSPMMGQYLSHLKNQKAAGAISPDENFAREIMQLFTIGLVQRHLDGSLKLSAEGLPIPTYDQNDITELARVFTGLSFSKVHSGGRGTLVDNTDFYAGNGQRFWQGPWTNPMRFFPDYHDYNEKVLFAGKVGERTIQTRVAPFNQNKAINDMNAALVALVGNPDNAAYNGHPNTPVFVSRLLIQRFTTSNPSAGYLHRVATKFRDTKGDLGQVIRAILLDYEVRNLNQADTLIGHGKLKEPILHFAATMRALHAYTGAPLAVLNTMTVPFTTAQSPVTQSYDAAELAKFPAGAVRFRFADTSANLSQSPQSAPSVFNWFLPDYVLPGPLATAGLVAPEFQVITESNLVNIVNYHYQFFFANLPPATNAGRGLNPFFNLSAYRTAGATQLSVPAYGVQAGYFTGTRFNTATQAPDDIATRVPHLLPAFASLVDKYNQSLTNSLNGVTVPTVQQRTAAHTQALSVVADEVDLLLAAGRLKAVYGEAAAPNPRSVILANVGLISNNNRLPDDPLLEADVLLRVKNLAYLIATTPQAALLR